ncbi:scavenger receptor class F member 2-like [Salmo salar]|uniref:Scavenger receptor class F member 2-like n=1 Tax=Salmo salar TaxID=8030 RepID=A0A1S3LTA8_SALSA|nr:scavenger receptor class F member 2-like [Salmo salar]
METTRNVFVIVLLNFIFWGIYSQELNPRGRNVCEAGLQCCSGFAQQGDECLIPICESNFTCKENEVCVRPNECRCRSGYFGATCDTKCPSQFWGPDCRGKCDCHPNGSCEDVTGACTCNPNRWGPNCERACDCQKGQCNQETGACTCYAGFWGSQCSNNCHCSINSVCDVGTGQCHCNPGWYERNCAAQCACNGSPCDQLTGRCKCRQRLWGTHCERMCQCIHGRCNQADGSCTCRPGFRGKFCREPCPAGFYGQNCRNRCGHCKGQQPCKVAEGRCVACERGWNGTRCDQMCAPGFFGENCEDVCSPCKDGHFCNRIDGYCPHCNPGWMGDRCELKCLNGTYGENCVSNCNSCFNGMCHFATGECLCDPGFSGAYCNVSCSEGQYGVNCAQICSCHDNNCNTVTGACNLQPNQRMGVMAAGVLVTCLLLLLLSLLCCCCICRQNKQNDPEKKSKRRLCGGFTRISSKLPCIPLRRQKLPKVDVSHHDPENTFNCSFIEPPSAVEQPTTCGSSRASSSVETTGDGHVYAVPDEPGEQNKNKGNRINTTETRVLADYDDISEVDTLPENMDMTMQVSVNTSELPLHRSSENEGSCSGTESASSIRLRAHAPQPPQQSSKENSVGSNTVKDNGKPIAAERVKPRPPDPSTKPKLSWVHASPGPKQNNISQEKTVAEEKMSSRKKASKQQAPDAAESACTDGAGFQGEKKPTKNRSGMLQIEHINGAVQSVLRKMGNFHADRKPEIPRESAENSPSLSLNREVNQLNIHSEAASLLAAQLKEKTQSLNRSETGCCEESLSHLQAHRKKPTSPQKTTGTQPGAKALLPTSASSQKPLPDTPSKEAKIPEKQDSTHSESSSEKGDSTVKKAPMTKPPRKKNKEGNIDAKTKTITPRLQ